MYARVLLSALTGLAIVAAAASSAKAYQLVSVAAFDGPVDVREAPGYPNRLFVVEQPGRVMLVKNGVKLATPFLDITDLVKDGGEEGLLSLAFPPDFKTSRRFYVWYTNNSGNLALAEFRRSKTNPDRAVRSSRRTVLIIPHPNATNHNGGQMHFDGNGRLYISVGDGGNPNPATFQAGEPSRNLSDLRGKILRINPKKDGRKPYTIPKSNPFVGKPGRNEIYAYGVRNPWRMSLEQGSIFVGDVGQGAQEEVTAITRSAAAGGNFGWPEWEGTFHYRPSSAMPNPIVPILTYPNPPSGPASIVGGYVMNDPDLPDLAGRYIYADAFVGEIRSFEPDIAGQQALDDGPIGAPVVGFITSFGRGLSGQIYVVGDGQVFRLEPPPN